MKRLLFLILLTYPFFTNAQYFIDGQSPANVRWRQISNENFQLIYPESFEDEAQQMAYILDKIYDYTGYTLSHNPGKISIILRTHTVRSNGFAAWAPARVEMLTTPGQGVYPCNWLEQLAVHEYRHVVQIDKVWEDMPKIFKILLGEQAAPIVLGAYLPMWILEGDAVATETSLSRSGRGRLPSFEMELKAQALEKGLYSYDKAYMGSFRDYVPDYYQLGYHIVAGAREKYGADVWEKVFHNVGKKPLSITPFDKSLKQTTGSDKVGLYREVFNNLMDKWKQIDSSIVKTPYQSISKKPAYYTNYKYPFFINDSLIFAARSSIEDISRFVAIAPDGKEEVLFTPGYWLEESVSFGNGNILWVEYKPDVRWGLRDFSLLRRFNISDKKLKQKRFKEKIYAPVLSPDGKYIAAVKSSQNNIFSIVLISPDSFEIVSEVTTPENYYFITPSWSDDSKSIYAVVLGQRGKAMVEVDPFKKATKLIYPFSFNEIRNPVRKGEFLYYSSAETGIDNIFALDLGTGDTYQVTSARFGATHAQPSVAGDSLVYSNYSSDGFAIVKSSINREGWKKREREEVYEFPLAKSISDQELGAIEISQPDTVLYESKKYRKAANLFNFHSWSPAYVDVDDYVISPGVSLMSQNKLSTATTQLGYKYSIDSNTGKWYADFRYYGFFPVLQLKTEYGRESSHYLRTINHTYPNSNEVAYSETIKEKYYWDEFTLWFSMKFPIDLSRGRWYKALRPELSVSYTDITQGKDSPQSFFSGTIIPIAYRLNYSVYQRSAKRDLQPRWGQLINLNYRHSPIGDLELWSIWSAEGVTFLPGILKHHGIKLYYGYQEKENDQTSFSDIIKFPRGVGRVANGDVFSIQNDYLFPLFYPDWNIGRWVYFRRFNLGLFYDHAQGSYRWYEENNYYNQAFKVNSYGAELTTDCNFLRLIVSAKMGVRISYAPKYTEGVNSAFFFSFSY